MCDKKVIWGIVRQDKTTVPTCNDHMGVLMEAVFKKDGPTFAFAYVGDRELPHNVKCVWSVAGLTVTMEARGEVVAAGTQKTAEPKTPLSIGAEASVQVF